jgi:hypothetical protein
LTITEKKGNKLKLVILVRCREPDALRSEPQKRETPPLGGVLRSF